MKTIAYIRVSTAQQDACSQRLVILEYARKNGFQIDDFVEATARGQATARHRRLDELIGILNRGDRLVVSELSRLGRSLSRIVTVLDGFEKAGIAFIAIKENIRVEGNTREVWVAALSEARPGRMSRQAFILWSIRLGLKRIDFVCEWPRDAHIRDIRPLASATREQLYERHRAWRERTGTDAS